MDDASAPPTPELVLPRRLDLYYGGAWRPALSGRRTESRNPGSGVGGAEAAAMAFLEGSIGIVSGARAPKLASEHQGA